MSLSRVLLGCFLLNAFTLFSQCGESGLIINEFTNGDSGTREYVELLVVGCPGSTADIRNFIIDDNNGDFSNGAGSGKGIAPGFICFSHPQWQTTPVGAIIVVYNNSDVNIGIGNGAGQIANDESDANNDLVYVLPANSSFLGGNNSEPNNSSDGYGACNTGSGNWSTLGLRNGGDAMQVRKPDGSYFHGISFGASGIVPGPDGIHFPGSGSGRAYHFNNASSDDYRNPSNFERVNATNNAATTQESAGRANSSNNQDFIDFLQTEQTPNLNLQMSSISCSEAELSVDAFCAYEWRELPGMVVLSNNQTITVNSAGDYQIAVTDAFGCIYTETINVSLGSALDVSLNIPTLICLNESFTATVTGPDAAGATFDWSLDGNQSLDNGAAEDYAFNSVGSKTISVFVESGGCSVTLSQNITVNENNATLDITPNTVCTNEPINAAIVGAATPISAETWSVLGNQSNDGGLSENYIFTNSGNQNINVNFTDANGCTANLSENITVNENLASLNVSNTVCLGEEIEAQVINAGPGATFNWSTEGNISNDGGDSERFQFSVNEAVSVTVTDANGCVAFLSQNITVNENNAILSLSENPVCANVEFTAKVTNFIAPATFSWSAAGNVSNDAGSEENYSFSNNSTITVDVEDANGCAIQLQEMVQINAKLADPNVTSVEICFGEPLPNFSNGETYTYLNEDSTITTNTQPDFSGFMSLDTTIYAFRSLSGSCNSDTLPIRIVIHPENTPPADQTLTFCQNEMAAQLSPNTEPFEWFDASNNPLPEAPTPNTLVAGTQQFFIRDTTNLCPSEPGEVTISVNPAPNAPDVNSLVLCLNDFAAPLQPNGNNFFWRDDLGNNFGNNAPTPSTTNIGTQTFFVREIVLGCSSPESNLRVDVLRTPDFMQDSTYLLCTQNGVLDLEPRGDTVQWFDGIGNPINAPTVDLSQTQSLNFSYHVFNQVCIGLSSNVSVEVLEQVDTPNNQNLNFCQQNDVITLDLGLANINWLDDNLSSLPSAPNIDLNTPGVFNFFAFAQNGHCISDTASIMVTVEASGQTPDAVDEVYCQNNIQFPADIGATNISWLDENLNPIAGTPNIDLRTPSSFQLFFFATNNGCPGDTNTYNYLVNPRPDAPSDHMVDQCIGDDPMVLQPTGADFTWFTSPTATGQSSITTNTQNAGTYSVFYTITDPVTGCESEKAEVIVRIADKSPAPNIQSPQQFCLNDNGLLTPDSPDIIWYTDVANNIFSTNPPVANTSAVGEQSFFAASIASGCASDPVQIIARVKAKPQVPTFPNIDLCVGDPTYTPNYPLNDITWFENTINGNNQNTPFSTNTNVSGTFDYVYYRTLNGCNSDTSAYSVTVNSLPPSPNALPAQVCENALIPLPQYNAPLQAEYIFNNGDNFLLNQGDIVALAAYSDYSITLTNTITGCSITDNYPIEVTQVIPPNVPDLDVCDGDAVDFNGFVSAYDNVVWMTPDGQNINEAFNTVAASKADSGTHTFTVFIDACSQSSQAELLVRTLPTVSFLATPTLCPNETAPLVIDEVVADGNANIRFNRNGNTIMRGATNPFANVSYGDQIEIVSITDDFCSQTLNLNLSPNQHPYPSVNTDALDYTLCNDSVMGLLNFTGEQPFSTVLESPLGSRILNSTQDTIIFYSTLGRYNILRIEDANCRIDTNILIRVRSNLDFEPSINLSDSLLCEPTRLTMGINNPDNDANYQYSISGSGFVNYRGSFEFDGNIEGCNAIELQVNKDQCNYNYRFENEYCLLPPVQSQFVFNDEIDENTQGLLLLNSSTNYDSLVWRSEFESFNQREQVIFNFPLNQDSIRICLEAHSLDLCSSTFCRDFVRPLSTLVYIPNAFTPNNDGTNETFLPVIFGDANDYSLEIFNRWGELIFESKNRNIGWDGIYKGTQVPNGEYTYRLRFFNLTDFNVQYIGSIHVVR